jgi:hypothetical protein
MSDAPLYTSKSTAKSLWQEYRIYEDRAEFETHFGLMAIPFDHVESVEVSESEVKGLLKGDLHLRNFRPALKLDWANFLEHVVLDKAKGKVRRVLFTPEDPAGFKKALDDAVAAFRAKKAGKKDGKA